MMRKTVRLFVRCAAAALIFPLALSAPLAAQETSGTFNLPQPTPTPAPTPAGPADERAGVTIPPRSAPAPRIAPEPVLTPEPAATATPTPAPAAAAAPPPTQPSRLPSQVPGSASAVPSASPPTALTSPGADPLALPTALPSPDTSAPAAAPSRSAAPSLLPASLPLNLPGWWPWVAGGLGGLALLAIGFALGRRRRPAPPLLAEAEPEPATESESGPELPPALTPAPAPGMEATASDLAATGMPQIDIALDITSATRSLMNFTIAYRLVLTNRGMRAASDLAVAMGLSSAQAGTGNGVAPGAVREQVAIDHIGPQQSRSVTGELRLPLSAIAVLRQGRAAVFVPLMHATLVGEGKSAVSRSFVIGTPSSMNPARLHPILLDTPPGSVPGLRAQEVEIPEISAAA